MLQNESKEGDALFPGQEPRIAPGVQGIWFDTPRGIYIPLVMAENPGNGDVARMLDGLPSDRRVVFPCVINEQLDGMLRKRGFADVTEQDNFGEDVHCLAREPVKP